MKILISSSDGGEIHVFFSFFLEIPVLACRMISRSRNWEIPLFLWDVVSLKDAALSALLTKRKKKRSSKRAKEERRREEKKEICLVIVMVLMYCH